MEIINLTGKDIELNDKVYFKDDREVKYYESNRIEPTSFTLKGNIDELIDGNTLTYVSFSDDVTRVTKLLDDEAKKFIKLKIDEWQYRLDNYER